MASLDFYNTNEHRKYPLVFPSTGKYLLGNILVPPAPELPDEVLLDCGFTLGPLALFETDIHSVVLDYVKRVGDNLHFSFKATSPGITSQRFVFVRSKNSPWGATDFVECAGSPDYGIGFLATGNLLSFWGTLVDGFENSTVLADVIPIVEPALNVSELGHRIQSINVGNLSKAVAGRCCDTPTPVDPDEANLVATGLTGQVVFREGYNMTIYASEPEKAITFVPIIGAGKGEPCDPVSDGTPQCKDMIFTINGVKPSNSGAFNLTGSNGIYVDPYPSLHKIVIRGEIDSQVICAE